MIRGFYTVEEVSLLSGLRPSTIRAFCRAGASTLIRGRDFTVLRRYRFGLAQQKLVFSKIGLRRLIERDYVRLHEATRRTPAVAQNIIDRALAEATAVRPCSPTTREFHTRQRQLRALKLAWFLVRHPCATPTCRCSCHGVLAGNHQVSSVPFAPENSQAGRA